MVILGISNSLEFNSVGWAGLPAKLPLYLTGLHYCLHVNFIGSVLELKGPGIVTGFVMALGIVVKL